MQIFGHSIWMPRSGMDEILIALSRQLQAELVSLGEDPNKYVKPGDAIGSADVYRMEMAVIDRLGVMDARIRILSFREMLMNLSTEKYYGMISKCFLPDVEKNEDIKMLRRELRALCGRLYRRYSLVTAVEAVRSGIARRIILVAITLSVPLLMHLFGNEIGLPVIFGVRLDALSTGYMVALMGGASGAAVSAIVRLYDIDIRHEPLLTWLNLEKSSMSVWVAPVLGGVFACVLMLVFYSNVIHFDLVPNFRACWWTDMKFIPANCPEKADDLHNTAYADIAKVILWSFIAGWAERFVPDALNRLTDRGRAAIDAEKRRDPLPLS